MNILGINVGHGADAQSARDGGACLASDGRICGAIAEERLTRQKHCGGYKEASRFLLRRAGLTPADLDLVIVSCYGEEPRLELFGDLGYSTARRVEMVPSHHLSHAWSAFAPSEFEEALILVADNEGNILGRRRHAELWKNAMERCTMYRGHRTSIDLLERDMDEEDVVSLGELYGNMTRFIGFETYLNAGKTMALASFGDPHRFASVPLIERLPGGRLRCPLRNDYFNSSEEIRRYFAAHGHHLPLQRDPRSEPVSAVWEDLAAALQSQLEEALVHKVRYWIDQTGLKRLCLAGGVALNCVANRRLLDDTELESLYVQPNAGDQGQGLGNVLYAWHSLLGFTDRIEFPGFGVYLGGAYGREEICRALQDAGGTLSHRVAHDVVGETAQLLATGAVVGWFQGASEWGPRALGNRSILGDPRNAAMRDHINSVIKHRESFRPFAPVVTWEDASRFFEITEPCLTMTVVAQVRKDKAASIPAVVHIDGTARIQTVEESQNPRLHALLKRFESLSGVPVLVNTSFNDAHEPIVETPADALRCFSQSGMDVLVLDEVIVTRKRSQ